MENRFETFTVLITALTAIMILEIPGWLWWSLGLTAVIMIINLKNLVRAVLSLLRKRAL